MTSKTIFVGGIGTLSHQLLENHFSRFGTVKRTAIKTGYAFITFDSFEQAADACDFPFQIIGRKKVRLFFSA